LGLSPPGAEGFSFARKSFDKPGPLFKIGKPVGVVVQLVEHHNGIVGVRGSNPLGSTILRLERNKSFRAKDGVLGGFSNGGFVLPWVPSCGWQAILEIDTSFLSLNSRTNRSASE
jgi:hypothetical protein